MEPVNQKDDEKLEDEENEQSSKEAAENISEDIKKKYGVKTAVMRADLAKESEVRELASKALEVFGRVDVLVNNAGIALYDEFQKKTVQGFEQSMQVNLYAPFLLTQFSEQKW